MHIIPPLDQIYSNDLLQDHNLWSYFQELIQIHDFLDFQKLLVTIRLH